MNLKTIYTQPSQNSFDVESESAKFMSLEILKDMDRNVFMELGLDYDYYQFNEVV
jgi:hypothetical protein